MRKIVTLGLLALTLSLISSQLLAGQFAACEAEKQDYQALGVYGLCNAWHNAKTPEAQAKFAEKFADIWRDELGNEAPLPDWLAGGAFKCPCWLGVELADFSAPPSQCSVTSFILVEFGTTAPLQVFFANGENCYYEHGVEQVTDLDENGYCFTELMDIIDDDDYFGGSCGS